MAGDIGAFDIGTPRQIGQREQDIVLRSLREFGQYQLWRNTHASQWEEAALLIDPDSRNTFFFQNFNWPGQKKTQEQVDSTGMLALHRFVGIVNSLVTPRNMFWHGLEAEEESIRGDRGVKEYFEQVTRILFRERYASTANYFSQNKSVFKSLGAFGNGTMFIDRLDGRHYHGARGLRYRGVPLGETYFGCNHQGIVDRMIRWFRMPAYAAVQKWGLAALPAQLRAPLEQDSQWPYGFLHCVRPRDEREYDPEALDERRFPFESYYISLEGRCLMGPVSGYEVFPFAVSRYEVMPQEVYGRGPAQFCLPTLKTLNSQKRTFLKAGHRAADPVLFTNDDGIVGMDLRPGVMNKGGVSADGKPLIHTLPVGDIQINERMMGMEVRIIDDTFLVSLLRPFIENPNMTATQVIELVNERGMLIAPTLGGQFDYISHKVEREVSLLSTMTDALGRPMLPPMPPKLREAGGRYRVTDTSPLSREARMGEAAGFNRWVDNLRQLANETQDPSWLDPVNNDAAAPELADIYSVKTAWVSTDKQIAAKRKARADQQAEAARIQALPAEAAMVKAQATLSKSGIAGQPQAGFAQ